MINMEPDKTVSVVQNEDRGAQGGGRPEFVDVELIRRVKSGDVKAFEELFNRYQKRVYNLAYRLVGNENDAAELTQEVFVRVYNSISKLRAEEAFLTWLRTLTVNLCRDFIRRRPPRTESLDASVDLGDGEVGREIPDPSAGPEKLLLDEDRKRAVRRAVQSLQDDHRAVITLHHLEGLDVKEIAKLLGSPVGTIKSRLARGREELKRKLLHYVE